MLNRAAEFMWRSARLVDRQLFAHLFQGGDRESALAALKAYQNPDGGFGNALEPDIRDPHSQPIATEKALHMMTALGPDPETLERTCTYLASITTPEGGVPRLMPSALGYPRAPWWETGPTPPASFNPTAGLAGLLYRLGVRHPWLDQVAGFCWSRVEEADLVEMHDLQVALRYLESTPDRERAERAFARLTDRILAVTALDPAAGGYVKKPLDWAPSPASLCRRLFNDEVIEAHLTALAARQQEDGGWPIAWPTVSVAGENEWRGHVTVEALRTLRAYGKI